MPKGKKSTPPKKEGKINIQRISEQRILDTKLVTKKTNRLPYAIAIVAALGVLVGAGVLAYLFFAKNPAEPEVTHEIIVPEAGPQEKPPVTEEATTTPETNPRVLTRQVEILETPTGFLNVRSGAGTNFAKIGQVDPGSWYELISEIPDNGGWYQIKLDAGKIGWITKRYAREK